MTEETFWLVVAISMVVIAISAASIAWAVVRLAREAGQTADATNALVGVLNEEIRRR